MTHWTVQDIPDQTGKLAIVTGGNSGIGFETAQALAHAGAHVIVAARSEHKGEEAIQKIKQVFPSAQVEAAVLDLADLSSIAAFARHLLARGHPLDLLINNAGVMAIPQRRQTRDGFEMHIGTNHLGHFALTGQVFPLLIQSQAPRVVTVGALIARRAEMDLSDLNSERHYRPMKAYGRSKLANLLFAIELARRTSGMGLIGVAVHPGTSFTGLQQHSVPPFLRWAVRPLFNALLGQSALQSALPSLYGATASPMSSGSFIGPTGRFELRGAPGVVRLPERALDENVARALWEVSERLTQVYFPWHDETSEISAPKG